jgi:hypothetical protein
VRTARCTQRAQFVVGCAVHLSCHARTDKQKERLVVDLARLLSPTEMGDVYKAMAITRSGAAPPVGFGGVVAEVAPVVSASSSSTA